MTKQIASFAAATSAEREEIGQFRDELLAGKFSGSMPRAALDLLKQGTTEMMRGHPVAVVSVDRELTTEDAAKFLQMSRTHLINLLDAGAIAFHKNGNRRKLKLDDVLAYRERLDQRRRAGLEAMIAQGQADGLYDD